MAYTKKEFSTGQILTADDLNNMGDQIQENTDKLDAINIATDEQAIAYLNSNT